MLSSMKKQLATVLTLGALLSVAPAHAAWTPNKAQVSVAAALATGFLYQHKASEKPSQNAALKAVDAASQTVKTVVDSKYTKAALVAVAAGFITYNKDAIIAAIKSVASQAAQR